MSELFNIVFVVTKAYSCPLYQEREEFTVRDFMLSPKGDKQICLRLTKEFMEVLDIPPELLTTWLDSHLNSQLTQKKGRQQMQLECGGCTGLIKFECKKVKKSNSVKAQKNIIESKNKEAEKQTTALVQKKIYSFLREIELFDQLNNETLQALSRLMELRRYEAGKMLIEEGLPGTHLYILLSGEAAVVNKNGEIFASLQRGEVFGETSLLTGEPAYPSVCSMTSVQLVVLNSSGFRQALSNHPTLNSFFWHIVMTRTKTNLVRSGQLSSGMSGELACISLVDLFQMINAGGKTGKVAVVLLENQAFVLFKEGEIVHAACGPLEGKEALFSLLAQENGTFTYTAEKLPDTYTRKPRLGDFMALLMEGLHYVDETRAADKP